VLSSNLETLGERWASGLGPFADAFPKQEAQSLIRALFQNTGKRAALLSKIYNTNTKACFLIKTDQKVITLQ